ncbi:sulfotransferase, partial [Luminiphilus sp.]
RQAITLKPDLSEAHHNLGNALKALGRLDEAEESYEQAIAIKPAYAKAHNNLGITLQEIGRLDEAEASYRKALALKPEFADAYLNLATTIKFSSGDELFSQMYSIYYDPATSEKSRCHICFALAKASEDLQDCAAAFQFYSEGNALRKKQLGYNKAQDQKLFEKLKANHSSTASHTFEPKINVVEPTPVFIVGLPRSGTTLVEQIISSHPLVTGAGELSYVSDCGRPLATGQTPVDAKALTTFREQYLDALQQRSEGKAIVTDKMPRNFRFLGLIAKTLPEAKILHVKRDPAAVCWANYTRYFSSDALGYCYSLDDILHYHELYKDLMQYWHEAMPNRIYDLDYEALTQCQEEETRKLIDHLGLEWDDACLSPQDNARGIATASNVQVRRKVYQGSSEKWKRYKPYLNGALDHFSADNK